MACQFVKQSLQALAKLMDRNFAQVDLVAIYMDGLIVAKRHLIAAVVVDAKQHKRVLGPVAGSSDSAKVSKGLLNSLSDRGVGMNTATAVGGGRCPGAALGHGSVPGQISLARIEFSTRPDVGMKREDVPFCLD